MKDMTGERYGRLVVTEMVPHYRNGHTFCKCLCDCGNEKIIDPGNLRAGRTKSCGCLERESRYNRNHSKLHPGDRINHLTLLKDTGKRMKNKMIVWECKCDCGNIIEVPTSYLIKGWWPSCGCSDDITHHYRHDLVGVKVGHLTVIAKDPVKTELYKRTHWLCQCDCGNITSITQGNLLTPGKADTCGCGKFKSRRESLIEQELIDLGVNYTYQKRIPDCKRINVLPIDFFIEGQDKAIEYDGQQHFYPIEHWGGNAAFVSTQERDAAKTQYCNNNHIQLLRLPYTLTDEEIKREVRNFIN